MIKFQEVSKKFDSVSAVDNLSLTINNGELCVLIGPSGCGKSTTLRMINKLIQPSTGDIFINRENIKKLKGEVLRRQIGYVIQSVGLFPHLTVSENIAVTPKLLAWPQAKIAARTVEMLQLVNLDPAIYQNKYPQELSGGEAQRVGVARALAADPPLILMDEPFGAVDPLNRIRLQSEFAKIQKKLKKTVVFITHDIDEAIRLADKIAIMRTGKIVQYDTPENILAHPADKFVYDFIGADRALKRLSRFFVLDFMKPAMSIKISQEKSSIEALFAQTQFLWVTDDNGVFLGWISEERFRTSKDLKKAITPLNPVDVSVRTDTTLKEALSKMFGQGIKTAAVVDDHFILTGEVSFADIEKTVSSL